MRTRTVAIALAGLVAVGVLGAASVALMWDPNPTFEPAPNDAASRITDEELSRAAEVRVFFGHMSVGKNVLSGVRQLYEDHGLPTPAFVELPSMVGAAPGRLPEIDAAGGVLVHALIGENRHPYRKLENFEATLRGGLADRVDVALIKFCYVDIRWDTDVDRLFAAYTETMDRLEKDFPDVRFVHVTAPLSTGPYGVKDRIKVLVGRNDNATRARYNEMLRSAYPDEQIFDLAAVEASGPDGAPRPELYAGYSNDGEHLNDTGSALAAVEFLRTVSGQSGG